MLLQTEKRRGLECLCCLLYVFIFNSPSPTPVSPHPSYRSSNSLKTLCPFLSDYYFTLSPTVRRLDLRLVVSHLGGTGLKVFLRYSRSSFPLNPHQTSYQHDQGKATGIAKGTCVCPWAPIEDIFFDVRDGVVIVRVHLIPLQEVGGCEKSGIQVDVCSCLSVLNGL